MFKHILAIACLLLALAAPAWATDIVVASTTVPGFSVPNVGQSVSVTVTATNGSATVTSSAAFRSQWVGIGGFTVSLNNTLYTVSNVASTSSLTLTANFSGSTGSTTMIVYPYVLARLYYNNVQFYPGGSTTPILPGAPGSGPTFRQYAASIVNVSGIDTLYLPQMTIPATTDGTPQNTARISMFFHRADGALIGGPSQVFSCASNVTQFRIPTTTPTSWADICAHNAAQQVVLPTQYYTQAQIDAMLPSCSANQVIYAAATGRRYSCLTMGTGLSIVGSTLNVTAATAGSGARQAINVKVDYGCAGDGTTNDTTCVSQAITAAQSSGKPLYFTAGTYLTDKITANLNGLTIMGDGPTTTFIKGRNANQPVFEMTTTDGAVNFILEDIGIQGQGSSSGSSGHGIVINDSSSGLAQATFRNVTVKECGGKGIYVPTSFNVLFDRVIVDDVGGNAFEVQGGNTFTFMNTYVKRLVGAGTAGYRVYGGTVTFIGANGIDGCTGGNCDWGVFGRETSEDGVDSYVRATLINSNIEDFKRYGIRFKYYSTANFFSTKIIGPTSGTVTALKFEGMDESIQGIFDSQSTIESQGASWTSSYPIHANALPFSRFGISSAPYNQFYNGSSTVTMPQWGYQYASGISMYLTRSTGLAANLFQVGTTGLPSGYQSYFKSTATGNIGLGIAQITSQTAPPFVIENATSSPIFRVTTTGALQTNESGGLAFVVQDTSSNALFRAARADRWVDNVASSFAQLGGSGESGWVSGLNAATLPRLGITATKTQITDTDTGSAPAPGSSLLNLYKTTSGNAGLSILTSNVQTGNAITYNDSTADRFTVDANGYTTTRRLRLTPVAGDPSSPSNGDIAYNSSSGKFRCYQGGVWTDCIGSGGGGGGISTINPGSLTGPSVTFALGTAGTAPAISGAANTVTIDLPDMNGSGATRGLITNGTQTVPGAKTLTGALAVQATTTARQITPEADNTYDLGTSSVRWASIHVAGSSLVVHGDTSNTKKVTYGHNGTNGSIVADSSSGLNILVGSNGIGFDTSGVVTAQGTGGISTAALTTGVLGIARGGTNATSANYSTNGVTYYDGTRLLTTATGGAGTLCLVSTNGGAPTFGSCSGSTATAWDALTNPSANLALSMGNNKTAFTWGTGTSTNNLFSLADGSSNTGTGYVLNVNTAASSAAKPISITAGGTSDGVEMTTAGVLQAKGAGGITATALNGVSGNGLQTRTSAGNFTSRSIAVGSASLTVTNGDGVSGNPTLDTAQNIQTTATPRFAGLGLGMSAPTAGLDVTGKTLNTDATNTVGGGSFSFSVTKNDTNNRVFHGLYIMGTLNTGGSNANTTVDGLTVDITPTAATGVTSVLADFRYNAATSVSVKSGGILNAATGFQIANAATDGKYLRGDGTAFISDDLLAADLVGTVPVSKGGTGSDFSLSSGLLRLNAGTASMATTSAHIAAAISDETGTGLLTFNNSPTFNTQITAPLVLGGTGTGSSLTLQSTSGVGATDTIKFLVGNNGATEAMRVVNSGRVGIGVTSPSAVLDVATSLRVNASSSPYIEIAKTGGSASTWYLQHNTTGSAGFEIYNSANYLRFTDSGNVGLSTNGPNLKLEINSSTGQNLRLTYNDADGAAANYADFTTTSGGNLTIAPSGGLATLTGSLNITAGLGLKTRSSTSATITAAITDVVIFADATSNTITVNLPAAATACATGVCRPLFIKKIDTSANAVTIDGNSTETIDGSLTRVLSVAREGVVIISDGTNWQVIGTF